MNIHDLLLITTIHRLPHCATPVCYYKPAAKKTPKDFCHFCLIGDKFKYNFQWKSCLYKETAPNAKLSMFCMLYLKIINTLRKIIYLPWSKLSDKLKNGKWNFIRPKVLGLLIKTCKSIVLGRSNWPMNILMQLIWISQTVATGCLYHFSEKCW